MRQFYLNTEEIQVINEYRRLTTDQRGMVTSLVSSLAALPAPEPMAIGGNVSPIRPPR